MPLRLPQPVTLDALQEMMKDPRYWNVNHPERSSWSSMVSEGFQTLFPNPIQRDETGRQTDGADGEGVVHVRAYIRTVSRQPVDVSEYDRSAPTDNEHSAQSTATTLSEENKVPAAPPGVDIDTNINEALRHTAISP
ncbi:hypothetical protein [Azospirillum doebereinerae]|uniref:hypothetical protein n=1 Tax=Azospirillum doebereinerae TaxID=92933 RepID=UPI001B3BAD62|nr:hypothetical protein [Azospirillum doebereinerae]MCG5243712.1 hypothetical protein [Azospirillum doebereinerae]